jgi:hypothetical protein
VLEQEVDWANQESGIEVETVNKKTKKAEVK